MLSLVQGKKQESQLKTGRTVICVAGMKCSKTISNSFGTMYRQSSNVPYPA